MRKPFSITHIGFLALHLSDLSGINNGRSDANFFQYLIWSAFQYSP